MAVLAPSTKGLQKILNICLAYCSEWDILLNAKKTKNMCFGKGPTPEFSLTLNGATIPWENQWTYLGVVLQSGAKFGCSVKRTIASFYRSMNAILRIEGRSNDLVMLRLLESHCLPILTYGIEIIEVHDRDDKRQLRVAYNAIFRKIFGYAPFESATNLQHTLGRCTWEKLCDKRSQNFMRRCNLYPIDSLFRIFFC